MPCMCSNESLLPVALPTPGVRLIVNRECIKV